MTSPSKAPGPAFSTARSRATSASRAASRTYSISDGDLIARLRVTMSEASELAETVQRAFDQLQVESREAVGVGLYA